MKIALIGNMNNYMFAVTRYLMDYGYEAHMFFMPGAEHFQPKADTFDLNFADYCHEVSWDFSEESILVIKETLNDFDFFIGHGLEAAHAAFAGIFMDVYFPYGSDFYKFAWHWPKNLVKDIIYRKLKHNQSFSFIYKYFQDNWYRSAIVNARNVLFDYSNPEYENKLHALNIKGKFFYLPTPFIYLPTYENTRNFDCHWKSCIEEIRKKSDFLVLYHGRQEWLNSLNYKGNEFTTKNTHHLIKAFAKFVKNHQDANAKLMMIEYGGDIQNSKRLIEELEISNHVIWFPKMYRKDLMYLIKNADVCSGEFGRSYLTFGTIIEAMAMGKPVLHYREDALYNENFDYLYPLYNCREPDEIFGQLVRSYQMPEERHEMGKDTKLWVVTHFIQRSMDKIIELVEEKRS